MNMIEKVIFALANSAKFDEYGFCNNYPDMAKAAIETMREPTEEMINSAYKITEDNSSLGSLLTINRYRAMIDAALKED